MTSEEILRAATYERVSRLADDADPSDRERSVAQQSDENGQACDRYGWPVVARYADPGRSASRFATRARENWQHVLDAVKARAFDVLVVWETSRASRDPEEWIPLLAECRRKGIKIYVTVEDELYDPTKPRHWKQLATAGVDNAYASEETSQRVRRGVDAHAADGKPYGTVPYGYRRTYEIEPGTRKPVVTQHIDPDTAPIVQRLITSVYEGQALMSIARKLNDDGIPSPAGAKWTMRTVRRLALNPAYIGLRGHNGHTTKATWPPLVGEEIFYGARRILTDPKRTCTKPGRAKWLASCIARCGECGSWTSVVHRGSNRTGYQCRDRGCVWIDREPVDQYLTDLVITRVSQPQVVSQLSDGSDEPAVDELRGQLAGLRAQLDAYADDAAEGKISREFAAKVATKLDAKIQQIQREIDAAVTPPALAGLLSGDPGGTVADRWDQAPVSAKREVLRLLFASIVITKNPGDVPERVVVTWAGNDG